MRTAAWLGFLLSWVCFDLEAVRAAPGGPAFHNQNQFLRPADSEFYDGFSFATSLSGDTAIIGAFGGGVDVFNSGSAYLYQRSPAGVWNPIQELSAPDAATGRHFGLGVAISGNFAVVGAPDPFFERRGSAYVFERSASGAWNYATTLAPGDLQPGDGFGFPITMDGSSVIIGSTGSDGPHTNSGAAYVFTRDDGGQWNQTAKLVASDAGQNDEFGVSMTMQGNLAVIGSNSNANSFASGAAYVFEKNASGDWVEQTKLVPDGSELNAFGLAVDIHDSTLAISAPRARQGNLTPGAVLIYGRDGAGNWTKTQEITTDYTMMDFGEFGRAVAVSDDHLLIGSQHHLTGAFGPGAVYAYVKDAAGQWQLQDVLLASDALENSFGGSIALEGDHALVGAYRREFESGAAYAFNLAAFNVPEPTAATLALGTLLGAIPWRDRAVRASRRTC